MQYRPAALAVLTLAGAALLPAAALPGEAPAEASGSLSPYRGPDSVFGEIVSLSESSFSIRPWNPNLPRRLRVTAAPGARYYRQVRSRARELQPGELLLLVPEDRKRRRPGAGDSEGARPSPPLMRAVLRLGKHAGGEIGPDDRLTARLLLRGARPFFTGRTLGGVSFPSESVASVIGVLKSRAPLVILADEGEYPFGLGRDALIVGHAPLRPEDLKRGHTVLVHGEAPPAADGAIQARLIAVTREPNLSSARQRELIQRERKGGR